jgi:peptidyl-prolyl cis-trans isomerase B (cyclophilin B)
MPDEPGGFMQKDAPKAGETKAVIHTNRGDIVVRLFPEQVPSLVENFTELAKGGKYKDVPFHRVISGFMIQGGDFTNKNGTGGHSHKGPGTQIGDQYHPDLKHVRGALSYAKTNRPNSIGSQFFIVHPEEGAHFLDHPRRRRARRGIQRLRTGRGRLGRALDAIASTRTDGSDKPHEPQTIQDIEIGVFA